MEQQIMPEIIQWEPLLRKLENDKELIILDVKEEPGSEIGENYMSIITRIYVNGKRGNCKQYTKSFVVKRFPGHRAITEFTRNADFFFNEAHFYKKILPVLGPIGPKCIYATQEQIIMEDLASQGYAICKRQDLLDFEHCVAAVQALSTLHAKSLALKLKDPTKFHQLISPLKEVVFPQDSLPCVGISLDAAVNVTLNHLELIHPQSEELQTAINFVKSYNNKIYETMKNLLIAYDKKYCVLCHGDPWNNNLLFKHDLNGKIINVKLVDFQIARHASPALDFLYFIYTSAKISIIEQHYEDLVEIYHRTFIDVLQELEAPKKNIQELSMDWFKSELKKYSLYGLFTGFWLANVVLAEGNEIYDMDNMTMEMMEEIEDQIKFNPKGTERVKHIVLHYIRTYR